MTVPRNTPIERGLVAGHGYGGRDLPEFDMPGPASVVIFPCARGFSRSRYADIPDNSNDHVVLGIESRETYVHRGCVADYWGAASVLIEMFPRVARSLHYMGGSFGGGIGAMTLAWDRRFTSGYLWVPSFGNHPLRVSIPCAGSGHLVRNYYLAHPEVLDVLQYFDAASIARHIQIPVLCECALFDPAVPPPGQFSVYNAMGGPKSLLVRNAGHHAHPGEADEEQRSRSRCDEWLKRF